MDRTKNKQSLKILLVGILLIASFLRLYKLHEVPVSLFIDELDVGYHAYSILKTGKDYVGNFLPLHFESFSDNRTPLYLYSALPTVYLFGISSLGVRLPAAIFGIISIYVFYKLIELITKNEKLALISAGVMALSPWHIQYSRAGFEVTLLLLLLLLGFYFFFLSIENKSNHKYLPLWSLFFSLTPWVYNTAKLFVPFITIVMFILWHKKLRKIELKSWIYSLLIIAAAAIPILYGIFAGGASKRFNYISVFTDPVVESEINYARDIDFVFAQNDNLLGAVSRRMSHNKYLFWSDKIISNYLQAFSTEFLFIKGDINLRHSIQDIGQFYRIEFITLILGLILFFSKFENKKLKIFLLFWVLLGILPAAITRDGGNHATRLFIILPAFIFFISYGIFSLPKMPKAIYLIGFLIGFIFYQHQYWIHNPWYSERWWHAGYQEAIQSIKEVENDYDKIVITTASQPPAIMFAAWYQYPPDKWQDNNPLESVDLSPVFIEAKNIDKFYFAKLGKIGLKSLGKYIDDKTLFVAAAAEYKINLIRNPDKVPDDLVLVKSIAFPSGEPAFYLLRGKHETIEEILSI